MVMALVVIGKRLVPLAFVDTASGFENIKNFFGKWWSY
jgi:hypothetical protein